MVIAKKFVLLQHFKNGPQSSDLKLVEEELPSIKDGEYLTEAEFLSVDPYMLPYSASYPLGSTMIGSQVAKIIESKNHDYPVGKRVVGYFGWRTHTVVNPNYTDDMIQQKPYIVPDVPDLSPSLFLGVLGMPGNTAYFGFLEICKPKSGEILVVSGAAGAVGSHVGQIAKKVIGLIVIGIAGSDAKCKWLTEQLGFDHAINYKTQDLAVALRSIAPNGIDCYFDNVGGDISSTILYQMKRFGRISVCGSISSYKNDPTDLPKCTLPQPAMVFNQLKMEGFIVTRWTDQWQQGIEQNLQWIKEGKLVYRETVTKGFEKMFDAFTGMLQGQNFGKAIVQV